jgi:DNA-damage-inducible protein J
LIVLSTTRISVNIDGEIKQKAQSILGEIGMDMTTAIDLLLRTIVREERIPFDLRTQKNYREELYRQFIREELDKSKAEAADPNTKWMAHEDVMAELDRRRGERFGVQT